MRCRCRCGCWTSVACCRWIRWWRNRLPEARVHGRVAAGPQRSTARATSTAATTSRATNLRLRSFPIPITRRTLRETAHLLLDQARPPGMLDAGHPGVPGQDQAGGEYARMWALQQQAAAAEAALAQAKSA